MHRDLPHPATIESECQWLGGRSGRISGMGFFALFPDTHGSGPKRLSRVKLSMGCVRFFLASKGIDREFQDGSMSLVRFMFLSQALLKMNWWTMVLIVITKAHQGYPKCKTCKQVTKKVPASAEHWTVSISWSVQFKQLQLPWHVGIFTTWRLAILIMPTLLWHHFC